jgi:hypothetical protein
MYCFLDLWNLFGTCKEVFKLSQTMLMVFPPFHWVFSGGKERKRNKKKEIVKTLAHFFFSLHPHLCFVVSLGKQSIWCINFRLKSHYILTSFSHHSQMHTSFPDPHLDIHWFFYIVAHAWLWGIENVTVSWTCFLAVSTFVNIFLFSILSNSLAFCLTLNAMKIS